MSLAFLFGFALWLIGYALLWWATGIWTGNKRSFASGLFGSVKL